MNNDNVDANVAVFFMFRMGIAFSMPTFCSRIILLNGVQDWRLRTIDVCVHVGASLSLSVSLSPLSTATQSMLFVDTWMIVKNEDSEWTQLKCLERTARLSRTTNNWNTDSAHCNSISTDFRLADFVKWPRYANSHGWGRKLAIANHRVWRHVKMQIGFGVFNFVLRLDVASLCDEWRPTYQQWSIKIWVTLLKVDWELYGHRLYYRSPPAAHNYSH